MSTVPTRRLFLGSAVAATAGLLLPKSSYAAYSPASREPRVLKFAHTHTGEKLAVEYWRNGNLVYTSLTTATYPLVFDSTLYNVGAQVRDARIGGQLQ